MTVEVGAPNGTGTVNTNSVTVVLETLTLRTEVRVSEGVTERVGDGDCHEEQAECIRCRVAMNP